MTTEVEGNIKEKKIAPGDTAVRSLSCLCLVSDKVLIQEWTDYFAAKGCNLICHLADSMSSSRVIVAKGGISFTLTYFSDPAKAGKSLSPHFSIGSIWFPPLVVTVDRPPTEEELERFRLQGVAYIVERPFILSEDYPILNTVFQSKTWVREKSAPLLEILQTSGRLSHPVLITVTSPQGWLGRIYINEGKVIHAETPKETGVKAVAEILSIQGGRTLVHDIFLKPQSPNSSSSIQSTILAAMEILDESGNWSTASSANPQTFGATGAPESVLTVDEIIQPETSNDYKNGQHSSIHGEKTIHDIEKDLEQALTTPRTMPATKSPNDTVVKDKLTKTQTLREHQMINIDEIIKSDSAINGIAIADRDGNITDSTGRIDPEIVCAVANLGSANINDISSLLGLGKPLGWGVVGDKISLFVRNETFVVVAAVGPVTKNPETILRKLLQN